MSALPPSIGLAYLARGADDGWQASCRRFLASYLRYRPGAAHRLYVLFKGYDTEQDLAAARAMFKVVAHEALLLRDDSFDIGAYAQWAKVATEDCLCALNTPSEILADDWLQKLKLNLALPDVGLVGCTASYESLSDWNASFPAFPNPHIRSNAFMLRRDVFRQLTDGLVIKDKLDAFGFESGTNSMSRQIIRMGKKILLVGRNGRGYAAANWPVSETFRLGFQSNLLVADNQTRSYIGLRWNEKQEFVMRTWSHYIREHEVLKTP